MNTDVMFSSKTDLWSTPQNFFDNLNQEFDFNLDVCALLENSKCEKFYSPDIDGLKQEWGARVVQPTVWQRDCRMGQKRF